MHKFSYWMINILQILISLHLSKLLFNSLAVFPLLWFACYFIIKAQKPLSEGIYQKTHSKVSP